MKFKKVIILFLEIFILTIVFRCSEVKVPLDYENIEQVSHMEKSENNWKIGNDISLEWYINFNWWNYTKKWTDYPVLKEVTDITGVIPTISIPSGNAAEKLNLMIATNQLPDMITIDLVDPIVKKMISSGIIYSYDDLINKYVPEFRSEIPLDIWNSTIADDGKLYGLPSFFVPENRYQEKYQVGTITYNVRKNIYKELGSPDMSTLEGFIDTLRKFKQYYPEINGKPSIPLSLGEDAQARDYIEKSFGIRDFYIREDVLNIRYKHPRYPEVAKFLNRLYREGLLDQENFVEKDEQVKQKLAGGRVFAYIGDFSELWDVNASLDRAEPYSHFIAVEPLKADDIVGFPGQNRLGWTMTAVTKTASNPAAAIKLIRYMWSKEGNLLMNWGHKGENYKIEGDIIKRTQDTNEKLHKDFYGFCSDTGIFTFRFFYYSYFKDPFEESADREASRKMADKYAYDNSLFRFLSPDPTSSEGTVKSKIDDILYKDYGKIVMAESEAAAVKALDEMVQKMDKAGLSELEKYWTNTYKKMKSKLQ